jgi:hypothetical protein
MKKLFILLVLLLTVSTCHAKIQDNRFAVGGVYPGMPVSKLIELCGQPYDQRVEPNGVKHYSYFKCPPDAMRAGTPGLLVLINKDNIVHSVTYDEECPKKLATPDDVTVGVIPDDILKVYGTPDEVLPPIKGQSGYLYKSESAPSEVKNMRFTIYEGRIVGIYITYTSTQKWDRLK